MYKMVIAGKNNGHLRNKRHNYCVFYALCLSATSLHHKALKGVFLCCCSAAKSVFSMVNALNTRNSATRGSENNTCI